MTQIWTHPRSSHKKLKYWIRCWWVIYFTCCHVHKHIHCVDLCDLESSSKWPKDELIWDLPTRTHIRWCWVNYFTSDSIHMVKVNKSIHRVDLSDLESRSRWPKYEVIWELPIKRPNTELGDTGSTISQVFAFTSLYTVLTASTLKVGQGDPSTNSSKTFT